MRILSLASFAACVLILLAGCTSSPNSTGSTSGAEPTHDHSPHTTDVVLKGNKFVNQTVDIYQGDTVHWEHQDGMVGHSVTSDTGAMAVFDNKPNCLSGAEGSIPAGLCMVQGDTYSWTFDAVGKVTYHCRAHPSMTGTINVKAHPTA